MNYLKYAEDIENRIDAETEDKLYSDWVCFAEGGWHEDFFAPIRPAKPSSITEWPKFNINDALNDYDLMLVNQLSICNMILQYGSGRLLFARSNYGVGILPSLYGAKPFLMPYKSDTLPSVSPHENGISGIKSIIESGIPNLDSGYSKKVFEFGEMLLEIKAKYPKIGKYMRIDHPDIQGPMDVCELLWGADIFYSMYDNADLLHKLLRNVTDTYTAFLRNWFKLCPNIDDYHAYFGALHKGSLTLRDDSAMNLSPGMFTEFISEYDGEIYETFGGGAMHYCGRGDHFIKQASNIKNITAINLSQPHLNNMETIFENTIDKGINIILLGKDAVKQAAEHKRPLRGLVSVDDF